MNKNIGNTKHGLRHSREYSIWANIKTRCYNKNNYKYKNYGTRGITMFEEWKNDFYKFYLYITSLENYNPKNNLTIDRIDNNKGYYPNNLRWATIQQQNRNKRNVIIDKDIAKQIKYLLFIKKYSALNIAILLNVSQNIVRDIKRGKTWKEVIF